MTMTMKLLAAIAAFTLLAAACGDDDGGGANSALVDAIVDSAVDDPDAPPAERDQIACYARNVANNLGDDRLAELGVTVDNVPDLDELALTDAETSMVVDELFNCVDVRGLMAESMVEDFGEEGAACVADKLDEDTLRNLFGAEFTGDEPPDIFSDVLTLISECGLDPTG